MPQFGATRDIDAGIINAFHLHAVKSVNKGEIKINNGYDFITSTDWLNQRSH